MDQVKICPVCGKANPVENRFCNAAGCKGNLMGVFPSLPRSGMNEGTPDNEEKKRRYRYIKKCPVCGKENPARVDICDCSEELFGVVPIDIFASKEDLRDEKEDAQAIEQDKQEEYYLRSEDGLCIIPIQAENEIIIGKQGKGGANEYLAGKSCVSREHLKVRHTGNTVIVTDISSNGTLINNRRIDPGKPAALLERDLISLGAKEGQSLRQDVAYFRLIVKKNKENKE